MPNICLKHHASWCFARHKDVCLPGMPELRNLAGHSPKKYSVQDPHAQSPNVDCEMLPARSPTQSWKKTPLRKTWNRCTVVSGAFGGPRRADRLAKNPRSYEEANTCYTRHHTRREPSLTSAFHVDGGVRAGGIGRGCVFRLWVLG